MQHATPSAIRPTALPLTDDRQRMNYASTTYVADTRIGFRFLSSFTWKHHVLRVAINDLARLVGEPAPQGGVLLDVGCGQGKSFRYLQEIFHPQRSIGLDADPHSIELASAALKGEQLAVELITADCADIGLADASVDIVFCHQTFHHLVEQERALAEFWRVLKPGGYLLFAESTKAYINSFAIRLFFRHPMQVQKSAEGYLRMLREQGFEFDTPQVSLPYLWWSRSGDFGLFERWGWRQPKAPGQRVETLVNVAARKPASP